jgi:hypothetical protein
MWTRPYYQPRPHNCYGLILEQRKLTHLTTCFKQLQVSSVLSQSSVVCVFCVVCCVRNMYLPRVPYCNLESIFQVEFLKCELSRPFKGWKLDSHALALGLDSLGDSTERLPAPIELLDGLLRWRPLQGVNWAIVMASKSQAP